MAVDVLHPTTSRAAVPAAAASSFSAGHEQAQYNRGIQEKTGHSSLFYQPKLTVGAPDDPYEKEADQVADRVMRMPDPVRLQRSAVEKEEEGVVQTKRLPISVIQRNCAECEKEKIQRQPAEGEEEEDVAQPKRQGNISFIQRKCDECEKEPEKPLPESPTPYIQAKAYGNTGVASDSLGRSIQNSKGGGSHLDSTTQTFMSKSIGADFSRVKIHADQQAVQSNREISARAFTVGDNIYFNEGQYQPHTDDGKRLLAHELTHVVQQGKAANVDVKLQRKEQPPTNGNGSVCDQYTPAPDVEISLPAGTNEVIPDPASPPVTPPPPVNSGSSKKAQGEKLAVSTAGTQQMSGETEPSVKPATEGDPAFQDVIADTGKQAKKQRTHEGEDKKTSDARNAVNVNDTEAVNAGAVVLTVDEKVKQTGDPSTEFNSTKFKEDLKKKITEQVPQEEKGARDFIKDGNKVNAIVDDTKTGIKQSEKAVVDDAEKISNKNAGNEEKKSEIYAGANQQYTPEEAGRKPVIKDPARAIPKPVEDEAVQMDEEHNADSLDKKMAENKLTDNQLAESEEPQFIETLEEKQKSQQELCQVPAKMRQAEMQQMQGNTVVAQKAINGAMGAMYGKRDGQFGEVQKSQQHVQTEDEKRLQNYYNQLKAIYETTEANVKSSLDYLECMVGCTFQEAIDTAFATFKTNVTDRLEYYYDWHIVNPDYEKEDKMTRAFVNAPIEEKINDLRAERDKLDPADPRWQAINNDMERLKGKKAKLRIERIFEEEKSLFVSSLDVAIDRISIMVADGLNEAKNLIDKGKIAMDREYSKLDTANQEKAKEATEDFRSKFADLETKVKDKENDLSEGLVKQYTESVAKLKSTFEDIRKEAAMSWWEKAWRKIKEIATIIFDIAKLLFNILVKAANVIGDIVAHPIRFFGNLIEGVSTGFKNFVRRLPEHLENIIFKLVMGVVPPDITLPEKWDAKGIFSFVLEFFGLSKKNVREQAVKRFGAPVVEKLEEGFELFVLFRNEGFAGLWEHIKEKIGNLKDAIIEEVKTFFKESIIKAAVEFLISALTPASGFIKVCKSIISVVMFFIKNLQNILKLLDSILDSLADIALGKIERAANKVEQALADILLIGIKFLAALVGINLDKIQSRISKIINAVRNPVNRALKWFFDKAEAFARKTGLLKLVEKGKEKFEKGKEWAKEKVERGKEKVKAGVKAVMGAFDWRKTKKSFKARDGKSHTLYVEKRNGKPVVIVESDPTLLSSLLAQLRSKYKKDNAKLATIDRAEELLEIVTQYAVAIKNAEERVKKMKDPAQQQRTQNEIEDAYDSMMALETSLTTNLHELLEKEDYAELSSIYAVEGLVGTHGDAPKRKSMFEADHQPSNKMVQTAAALPDAPALLQQIAVSRSSWATTITLHRKRHVKGRTYGSKAKPIAREFVDDIKELLKGEPDQKDRRIFIEVWLQKQAKDDAKYMLDLVQNTPLKDDLWSDINGQPNAQELKEKIVAQIERGESLIQNEKITVPLNLNI